MRLDQVKRPDRLADCINSFFDTQEGDFSLYVNAIRAVKLDHNDGANLEKGDNHAVTKVSDGRWCSGTETSSCVALLTSFQPSSSPSIFERMPWREALFCVLSAAAAAWYFVATPRR